MAKDAKWNSVIEDRFIGKEGYLTVTENVITRYEPVIINNQIALSNKKRSARIQLPEYPERYVACF